MTALGLAWPLAWREFIRFMRQRTRVAGAFGQPIIFWAFFGTGFAPSFDAAGVYETSYLEYVYPGILMMMLLFASIFASITVIEDRDAGFLQGVLVAPVPRLSIVFGKVLGGALIALTQVALFLLALFFIDIPVTPTALLLSGLALVFGAIGFCALGFMIAWTMPSTAAFHGIMMVLLMPMWMLSGALFPLEGIPGWLYWVAQIDPVTHLLAAVRLPFYLEPAELFANTAYQIGITVTLAWAAICLFIGARRVDARLVSA